MVNGNCAVYGCRNSKYRLKLWEKNNCEKHAGEMKKNCCCPPPFRLFKFPSLQRNFDSRKEWIRLLNRTTTRNENWKPGQSDMVCFKHFVDGIPTGDNPYPTLDLGYNKPEKKARRHLVRNNDETVATSIEDCHMDVNKPEDIINDHLYCLTGDPCDACIDKKKVISSLSQETTALSKENDKLRKEIQSLNGELENLRISAKKSHFQLHQ